MPKPEQHVLVCLNSRPQGHPRGSCNPTGANDVLLRFQKEFEAKNLFDKSLVSGTTCTGPCTFGPIVTIYPDGIWYSKVTPDDVPEIVHNHVINGKIVEHLLLPEEAWD